MLWLLNKNVSAIEHGMGEVIHYLTIVSETRMKFK